MIDFYQNLQQRLQNAAYIRQSQVLPSNIKNFGSNDYLGLCADATLCQHFANACKSQVGAGSAHLLGGSRPEHAQLEADLCAFSGFAAALLFSNGFMANLALTTALLQKNDSLIQDKKNHASLLDGAAIARANGVKTCRFVHNDPQSLQRQLANAHGHKLVCVDGVFSMDGDIAPLDELIPICQQHQALLAIDDAHGFGVLGNGRGTLAHFGYQYADFKDNPPVVMLGFGKALGGFGAAIIGSPIVIDSLRQFARSYIFTTASPPALAHAHRFALELLACQSWRRRQLFANIEYFRQLASQFKLPLLPSATPIQPILIGNAQQAVALADSMRQQGFYTPAVVAPTVAQNGARLRISLTALHQKAEIEELLLNLNAQYQQRKNP